MGSGAADPRANFAYRGVPSTSETAEYLSGVRLSRPRVGPMVRPRH